MITATGTLGRAVQQGPDPTPVYAITDEASGTPYRLVSGFVNLENYVGQRVTIQGERVPGPGTPGGPLELNVTQIQPAAVASGGSSGAGNGQGGASNGAGQTQYSNSGGGGTTATTTGSGPVGSGETKKSLLSSTGGVLPILGVADALLAGGGLLVRRLAR